jgi:hypothetical protein
MPEFSFHLANISTADAIWLGQVCALFSDPAAASRLADFRAGRLKLMYGPQGALTLLAPVTTVRDLITTRTVPSRNLSTKK